MKRTIVLFLVFVFLSIPFLPFFVIYVKANANSKYLRVINETTPFYKSANELTPLFYLPYTYYVKPLGVSGTFTYVECYGNGGVAALDGYVPTEQLFDDGQSVANPYVVLELTTQTTAILYKDQSLSEPLQYLFAERQLKYYGLMTAEDENLYYVSYNGKLGYVKESDVYPFLIANHPNELTFLPKDSPEELEKEQTTEATDLFTLKITIFVCLGFAGLVALIIALKGPNTKRATACYYDENDYE